jgi:hypothetical protein
MKEINFFGVFLSPFLGVGLLAFGVLWVLRLLLARLGFYRHVWHRSLFDLSLYLIVLELLVLFARRHHP